MFFNTTTMLRDSILLLPSFICLFWGITLLLEKKTKNRSQKIWILATFVMGVSIFIWSRLFNGVNNYRIFYKIELIEAFTTLLLLPLLYLGFRTLVNIKPLSWKEYLWFLPSVLISGSMFILYMIMGEEQAAAYIREIVENQGRLVALTEPVYRIHNCISVYVYAGIILLQIIYMLIYATTHLVRYRRQLNSFFANSEGKSVKQGTFLLALLYFVLIFSLVFYRGRFHYNESSSGTVLITTVWAIVVYLFGYNVFQMRYTAETFADELEKSDKEAALLGYGSDEKLSIDDEKSQITTNEGMKKLIPLFNKIMDEDKMFLRNDLRIDEIAKLAHTNRTYISLLLREEYHCNFFEYVTSKRIEYAKEQMRLYPNLTQEELAEMSGFTHDTSFSRAFKQYEGITFREWRKKHLLP